MSAAKTTGAKTLKLLSKGCDKKTIEDAIEKATEGVNVVDVAQALVKVAMKYIIKQKGLKLATSGLKLGQKMYKQYEKNTGDDPLQDLGIDFDSLDLGDFALDLDLGNLQDMMGDFDLSSMDLGSLADMAGNLPDLNALGDLAGNLDVGALGDAAANMDLSAAADLAGNLDVGALGDAAANLADASGAANDAKEKLSGFTGGLW